MYIYIYVHVCVHIYSYIYVLCMHVYMYMYTHTYKYTQKYNDREEQSRQRYYRQARAPRPLVIATRPLAVPPRAPQVSSGPLLQPRSRRYTFRTRAATQAAKMATPLAVQMQPMTNLRRSSRPSPTADNIPLVMALRVLAPLKKGACVSLSPTVPLFVCSLFCAAV